MLEPHSKSLRKRVTKAPKFYFFDLGVCRALANVLNVPANLATSYFGELFESFVILELFRKLSYNDLGYKFFYFATEKNEVDLVIERPGKPLAVVEIKLTKRLDPVKIQHMKAMQKAFIDAEYYCVSQDPVQQKIGNVPALFWKDALEKL